MFKVGALARICCGIACLAVALVLGTDTLVAMLPVDALSLGSKLALKALLVGLAGFVAAHLLLRPVLRKKDPAIDISEPVRSAYDVLSEGVVVLDIEGQILFANEAFHRLLGADARPLGQHLEQVLRLDATRLLDPLRPLPWATSLLEQAEVLGDRVDLLNGGAENRTMVVSCTPLLDDKGAMRGTLVVFVDRTEVERTNVNLSQALTKLKESSAQIEQQNDELRRLATTDSLSGALNRRAFFERANAVCESDRKAGQPVSVLLVDIDFFKAINDQNGHQVGDRAIAAVARVLISTVRASDMVCRYGGEEFCVLLHGTSPAMACATAERIRARIEAECGIGLKKERILQITASLGVASFDARSTNVESLIAGADKALYRAKREGRNRVCLFETALDDTGSCRMSISSS